MLRLFPSEWRERYGDDLLDHFDADRRRLTKWIDLLRTAAGLRWRALAAGGSDDALGLALVAALAVTLACDVVLGVGMDERIDADLLGHWWGAPFAGALFTGAVLGSGSLVAMLGHPSRRRAVVVHTAAVVAGSVAGSALFAAVSFDLAGLGAGVGLVVALAVARALVRAPLGRGDGLLVAALPMILVLGWRAASNPLGPIVLLVVAGALLATRVPHRPQPAQA